MLGIPVPESGIGESRSLFNRQHLITANRLIKLNEKYQLRFNANYLNDRHEKNSSTHQRHFLDGSEVITDEQTQLINRIHRGDLTLTLTGNHPQYFLENALHLQGDWTNTSAHVNRSEQGLKSPSYTLSDNFRWLKVIGRKRLDIQSNNKLSSTAQALRIQPGPYADFFNDSLPYEYLRQEVSLLNFKSSSSVSFSMSRGRWQSNYDLGLDLDVQQLHSGLSVAGTASADTLSNAFRFLLAKSYIAARYSYTNKKLTVSLSLPLGYAFQQSKEAANERSHTRNKPYLHPFFSLRYKIGYQWEISSSARFSNSFNTIKDLYTGYLLSDYRSISKNDGSFSGGHSQSYNVGISYNEPLRSITAGVSARYGRNRYDRLPEISYDGILSIRKLVESEGFNDTKAFGFNISKGIGSIITKINVYGTYLISSGHQQQQGLVLASETQGFSLNLDLDGKITSFVNYIYTLAYNRSHTDIEGTSSIPMGTNSRMQHNLRINVFPTQALTFGLIMNYSQSTTTYKLPSTFFMDLRAQYKFKRWELHLSWNNILNAKQYIIAYTSDFISSVHTFELRPANVVVSVRFSL